MLPKPGTDLVLEENIMTKISSGVHEQYNGAYLKKNKKNTVPADG